MKKLLLCFCIASCKYMPFTPIHDTVYVRMDTLGLPTKEIVSKPPFEIVRTRMLVSLVDPFGYLPRESGFFNVSNAVKGYMIQVKRDGNVVSTDYSDEAGLKHKIELILWANSENQMLINQK